MAFRSVCLFAWCALVQSTVFVNPAQRIFLDGQATHVGTNRDIRNVTWTIESGAFTSDSFLIGSASSRVVGIRENSLLPNETYIVRFSGRKADGSIVHDDVVFSTLIAPSQGSISVLPTSGIMGSTEFTISTFGWIPGDDSGIPLQYRFSYKTNASTFEVPLTVFSSSSITHDIVFEPLHDHATEVTIIARAINSLGVVGNVTSSSVILLYPNPSLPSATTGLLRRWQNAVQAQNLTSILRSGCLLSAVIVDTNATGVQLGSENVLDTMKESLANFSAASSITADVADLASHAVAQAALSASRNSSSYVETTLSILQQITNAAALDLQAVTENGTISQGMVVSLEFANNAINTISTVMSALLDDTLPLPAMDTAIGNALDAIADQHVVGRVCGEDMVISSSKDVQLVAGIRSGSSLSSMLLQLPSGSWSLPEGFFAQGQMPFNESCVPIRAYVLPVNIEASSPAVHFFYNTTDGSPPRISEASPEMGPDQAALFDLTRNYGYSDGSLIQYLRFGNDDTGIDGVKFNFTGGMVVTFQLPYPVTGLSVRCAYKENILDAWRSDDSCQLSSLNDTHGVCTCYHASAIVIQSAPVCIPKSCWELWWEDFVTCAGCSGDYGVEVQYQNCNEAKVDGCGGHIFCGSCNPGTNPTRACTSLGCVDFNHTAAITLAQEHCGKNCGYTMFPTGGSTICTCSSGFDCVKGECMPSPTCIDLGLTCGVWPNGQGGVVGPCGNCTAGQYCNNTGQCETRVATTAAPAPCVPVSSCPANSCGPYPDGCGGTLNCGSCPGSQTCNTTTNTCGSTCWTCWDYWNIELAKPGLCPCLVSNSWLVSELTCRASPDMCGGMLVCGFCTNRYDGTIKLSSDCTPNGCKAKPYNETLYGTYPGVCTQNCTGRCGWTMFNNCGSKLCTCPSGQVCSKGYCSVVQTVGANWAANFDGATGYWTGWSVVSTATQKFSLSFWAYANGVRTKDQYLFYNGVAKTNGWGLKIPANYPMNISVLLGGTGSPPTQAPFAYSLPIQRWTYITVTTINGTDWYLYENATLMASFLLPKPLIVPTSKFTVGGSYDAALNGNFDGRLDELQLWELALAPEDIYTNFMNGVSGFEPLLVMFMPFAEGTGTRAYLNGTSSALDVMINVTGTMVNWVVRVNNTNATWASGGGVNKRNVGVDPASRSARRAALPATSAVQAVVENPDGSYAVGSMRAVGLASENHVQSQHSQPVGKSARVPKPPTAADFAAVHPGSLISLIAAGAALLLAVGVMNANRCRAAAAAAAAGPAPATPQSQTCDGSSVSAGVVDAAVASQTSEPAPETPPASPKKERGGASAQHTPTKARGDAPAPRTPPRKRDGERPVCLPASPMSPANAKDGETVIRHEPELNVGPVEDATDSQAEPAAAPKNLPVQRVASSSPKSPTKTPTGRRKNAQPNFVKS
eukprot:TRINITY_DN55_c0_g2_i4.p1 TRINITY_DN55_c0_g2~~TRINITY_DN55_c0_g2_i4.p1  ORF type:complete len:1428 (-),score=66.20 TRINITY_DN55_c0_g2_i4:417-4700(-)